MAKLFASETAVKAADDCVQIHGGYGFVKDYPAEKFFRDVKLLTIGEGTSEIQRLVIARQLLALTVAATGPAVRARPRGRSARRRPRHHAHRGRVAGRRRTRPPRLRQDRPRLPRSASPGRPAPARARSSTADRPRIRATGRTVGVVAVDPTSPFTGGAILGDRVRMQAHAGDAGVFIRSMATRGHLGGLARATTDVALVLDAAGKDIVLIETVGVGQDEVDIVRTADISIVMLVPGSGDEVQALKAGIMEIADIFVVNKADREGADRAVASIEALLSLQTFAAGDGARRS